MSSLLDSALSVYSGIAFLTVAAGCWIYTHAALLILERVRVFWAQWLLHKEVMRGHRNQVVQKLLPPIGNA